MKEKTLSGLILFFAALGFLSYILGNTDTGLDAGKKYVAKNVFMVAFGVTPILVMMKLVSRIFLKGLDWMRLSTLEGVLCFIIFFLTKEARQEWLDCIDRKRNKADGS